MRRRRSVAFWICIYVARTSQRVLLASESMARDAREATPQTVRPGRSADDYSDDNSPIPRNVVLIDPSIVQAGFAVCALSYAGSQRIVPLRVLADTSIQAAWMFHPMPSKSRGLRR